MFRTYATALVVCQYRKLNEHFKHNTALTADRLKRQKQPEQPEHLLIQDEPTRWNSTYKMMDRLVEECRVLTKIMLDPKITKTSDIVKFLKDNEWDLVTDLTQVFGVFAFFTTYMCSENDVSCSEIFQIVCGRMNTHLKCKISDSPTIVKVKEALHEELECRYQPTSEDAEKSTSALASLLDPRYKRLPFFTLCTLLF